MVKTCGGGGGVVSFFVWGGCFVFLNCSADDAEKVCSHQTC